MREIRTINCDACHGEGFIEYGHPNAPDPSYTEKCTACAGTGRIEIEVQPADEQDVTVFMCGPRDCDHQWDGPDVDIGGGWARTCSRCGMDAMSHSLWTGP